MSDAAIDGVAGKAAPEEDQAPKDWTAHTGIAGALLLLGCVGALIYEADYGPLAFDYRIETFWTAFVLGFALPLFSAWRYAVDIGKAAWFPWQTPNPEHLSGIGFLIFVGLVCIVFALASWAANSPENNRAIHQVYGVWVVGGLVVAFFLVALAPSVLAWLSNGGWFRGKAQDEGASASEKNALIALLVGRPLSMLDAWLVYSVAGGAGAGLKLGWLRYGFLVVQLGVCAVLGQMLPAPWAFIPLAWGLLIAFAVSRRWMWSEDDLARAMLSRRFSNLEARVGFEQDLRDEALISFLFVFLIVPVALRQLHLWGDGIGLAFFTINEGGNPNNMLDWVGFYGTELAKAVPFVDWAEIYDVSGDAFITPIAPLGLHVVFITRVIIDLVILAALLQALAIMARDQEHHDLFYKTQTLDLLSPRKEAVTLRSLVRRGGNVWVQTSALQTFPTYNAERLLQLSNDQDEHLREAANALIIVQSVDRGVSFDVFKAADEATPDYGIILEFLQKIEAAQLKAEGPDRSPIDPKLKVNAALLEQARRKLNRRGDARGTRERIVEILGRHLASREAARGTERMQTFDALCSIVQGEHRDSYRDVRKKALQALAPTLKINDKVRASFEHVSQHDRAIDLRDQAQKVIDANPKNA